VNTYDKHTYYIHLVQIIIYENMVVLMLFNACFFFKKNCYLSLVLDLFYFFIL